MFFRTCNLENCLNHKRIKQRPTCKTKPNLITNACDALREWIKRVERVLRLFSWQLWINALTFSSLLHPEASVCHGMCMAWSLLKPWLSDCFTVRPALFLRSPLANYPNCTWDTKTFPSLWESAKPKVQHLACQTGSALNDILCKKQCICREHLCPLVRK